MTTPENNDNLDTSGMRIEEAIKNGSLENGFERFDAFVKMFQAMHTDVVQQMGRLNRLKQAQSLGKIDDKIAPLEENQIRHGFLSQLDAFKSELPLYLDMSRPELLLRGTTNQMDIIQEVLETRLRGHYEVEKLIPGGNSTVVFKLSDIYTKRKAVAKVLKVPTLDPTIEEEIGRVSELKHRNLIKVYGESLDRFPFFIICEFVDGLVLSEVLEEAGRRSPSQALNWLYELCDVLDYLVQKNIAHSNIRPSKIFIDREYHPMLSPFDIIKAGMDDRSLRKFREDCQYLSPEMLKSDGEKLDKRGMKASDQFTLGLVAYKILTGKDLFTGASIKEIIENRNRFFDKDDPSYRTSLLAEMRSPDLIALVDRTLQEKPGERFKDLHLLLSAIKETKSKLSKERSIVRNSYVRCLKSENELIKIFYDNLLAKLPQGVKEHFKDRGRQAYMFQMAVDALIEGEHGAENLSARVSDKIHKNFDMKTFELFLDTFISTLRGLHEEYQYEWGEDLQAAWDDVKKQSLAVIKYTLSK
ncbi:MAG: protein kinase domain-containing protein [Saprospiraceae bacterium]